VNIIPVRRCIDYALGLISTETKVGNFTFIIPAAISASEAESSKFAAWTMKPRPAQLNDIRYCREQLVSISGDEVLTYSVDTADSIGYVDEITRTILPAADISKEQSRAVVLISNAILALQPWSLLPVLPAYFVRAFIPLIQPFVGSYDESLAVLQNKMCKPQLKMIDGWDSINEQAMALGRVGDIKTEYFSGSCNPCRWYFKAMELVFVSYKIQLQDVRVALAALAAENYLVETGIATPGDFVANMKAQLNKGSPTVEVPGWAVTVYATFLWGWLNDFIETDFDFRGKFRRRVFLC